MKAFLALIGVIAFAVLITSCGSGDPVARHPSNWYGSVYTKYVNLPDGRSVLCVMTKHGVTCDWEGAAAK